MLRLFLLSLSLLVFSACETAREATDTAAEGVEDAADATAKVARGAADAAEDAAGAVAGVASDAYGEAREALGDDEVADDARVAVARVSAPGDTTTSVRGTVTFVETSDGVRVRYDLMGLSPSQAHGLHVHAVGNCGPADSDNDGAVEAGGAAGGHLNPMGSDHGGPDEDRDDRHAGDLGNVQAGPDGRAMGTKMDEILAFSGATSVVGKAIMVHANRDDLESDPGGMAGGRVGCGVIELAPMSGRM